MINAIETIYRQPDIFIILVTMLCFAAIGTSFLLKYVNLIKEYKYRELKIKQDIAEMAKAFGAIEKNVSDNENSMASIDEDSSGSKVDDNFIQEMLKSHHEQAIQQASIQFWFSIIAAVIGFIFTIIIMFIVGNSKWYEYVIKTVPGAIIETVSVLFIKQARETRDRATNFFKELTYEKQISKSVEIADSIENEEIKADVKSKIALHIIGINELTNRDK